MSDKETGGSAFPAIGYRALHDGMSLRDYFATKALQGALAYPGNTIKDGQIPEYAAFAYKMADAMLAERAK